MVWLVKKCDFFLLLGLGFWYEKFWIFYSYEKSYTTAVIDVSEILWSENITHVRKNYTRTLIAAVPEFLWSEYFTHMRKTTPQMWLSLFLNFWDTNISQSEKNHTQTVIAAVSKFLWARIFHSCENNYTIAVINAVSWFFFYLCPGDKKIQIHSHLHPSTTYILQLYTQLWASIK